MAIGFLAALPSVITSGSSLFGSVSGLFGGDRVYAPGEQKNGAPSPAELQAAIVRAPPALVAELRAAATHPGQTNMSWDALVADPLRHAFYAFGGADGSIDTAAGRRHNAAMKAVLAYSAPAPAVGPGYAVMGVPAATTPVYATATYHDGRVGGAVSLGTRPASSPSVIVMVIGAAALVMIVVVLMTGKKGRRS